MSFPYGPTDPLAAAMCEVMKTHPDAVKAISFRDGTDKDFDTPAKKAAANEHYYEWLLHEAKKLLKEKKKKEEPIVGSGIPSPKVSPPPMPKPGDKSFQNDKICNCPSCRKLNK